QENKGQIKDDKGIPHPEILFTGQADGYDIYLRSSGWSYILKSIDSASYKSHRIDIDFVNPNPVFAFETKNQIPGYDNFPVRNNESINYVLSFGEVVYKNIFNGIDLRFYYDDGNLRYDYIVHAGAKPEHIKMKIKHSGQPELNDGYGINIPSELGGIKKEKPFSYQIENHIRKEISSKYVLNTNILGFELGNYDITKELIIDPVSLISGKLKHLKSYFQRPYFAFYYYYSFGLSYRNIQRFKDNSVLNISNYAADKDFIEEGYNSSDIFVRRRSSFLPCVITKYDSANKKLWSVYHYEKHNNVIAWDADDSVIVIFAHTFNYYDTVSAGYTKKTVFASVYNHSGELLKRFELEKPEGIVELINPYLDYDPTYNYNQGNYNNYTNFSFEVQPISYEKTIKISDNKLNFLIIGRYMEHTDSNYNASLFFQKYDLEGKHEMTKEIRNNKIVIRYPKIIFEESNFGFKWITSDIVTARFLDDGGFLTISNNMIDHSQYLNPEFDVYTEFYNKDGEPVLRSDTEDDWTFFLQSDQLRENTSIGSVTITFAFTFDNDKNIYSLVSLRDTAVFNSKYKNLVRKNPYSNDMLDFHPYLFKFDSTLSLKWITQLINYDSNLTVGGATKLPYPSYSDPLDWGNILGVRRENYTRWNTGSTGVFVIDSTGNIYLPVLLDSTNLDGYLKKQFGARKLTITKISPDGNIIWQDSDVMNFGFDYKKDYFLGSELLIKNADIRNGTLYLDYYCSNAHTIKPRKDATKFDFDEFSPVPDLEALKIVGCEYPYDKLYDILFLKFNLDDSKLVSVTPTKFQISDTICVNHETSFKVEVRNEWHSPMEFEQPHLTGEGFRIVPNGAFTLQAGEKKEFTIIFAPKQHKVHTGSVVFKQNTISDFSHTVEFSGVTKAVIIETDLVWDLGTILINNTASGIFRIHNNGDVDSWIQGIKDLPEPFKQITPESKSNFIKGGEYLDYTIEFTPTDAGLFEYRYKIYAGTGCPDTLEVTIKGKGVTESIVINSDSLDYGYLYYCENITDTITIENVTNLPLTYNSAQIAGLNADNFTILEKPNVGEILVRGNPVKFVIEFKPLTPYGNKSAILEINTSEKTLNCPLKGEYAEIDISVNDIDMGIRNLNVLYDTVLTIRNNTRDNFTLNNIIIGDNRVTLATALPMEIPSMQEIEVGLEISSSISGEINTDLELIFTGRCLQNLTSNL
ncbi:MAG: choice-of-anchor D domain-containing protein, partial [Dehalococcoidales bacterium]